MDSVFNTYRRLAIIIVNYKTASLVIDCISSLVNQLDKKRDSIIIVDNNSGIDDLNIMKNHIEKEKLQDTVYIIESKLNGGFSAGNNLGIKQIKAEKYFLTNSDTVFYENTIEELLSACNKYPDVGIFGPQLLWPDGSVQTSCFNFPKPISEMISASQIDIVSRIFRKYLVPVKPTNETSMTEWISFASVLIRSSVFDEIGLMDDDFFMYYEDIDYCIRAKMKDIKIMNYPKAKVIHLISKSSGVDDLSERKKRLPAYYYCSRSLYYKKYFGILGYIYANLFWYVGRFFSLLSEVILRRKKNIPAYRYIDIWKNY